MIKRQKLPSSPVRVFLLGGFRNHSKNNTRIEKNPPLVRMKVGGRNAKEIEEVTYGAIVWEP